MALVDQELSVVPALTVLENMLLGDSRRAVGQPGRRAACPVPADPGRAWAWSASARTSRCPALGIGERQLIEVAKALGQHARLVILDEPTATLSDIESRHVFAAIRRVAATGLLGHLRLPPADEVLELCDRVTVLRDGREVATHPAEDQLTVDPLIRQMLGRAAPAGWPPPAAADRDRPGLRIERPAGARTASRTSP